MKKFFKFLLIVAIWLLIAVILVGGAVVLEQPVSFALTILGVLFGIWILYLIVRKLVARNRAKKRAENLVNVESPGDTGGGRSWRDLFDWRPKTNLERRFRRLTALLWRSRLREHGDPLFVLPWYMLLGQDGNGKTELLKNAGLSVPTIDDPALRTNDDSLDWWLYNEAIVLDTPGSYVGVDEEAPRHTEWPTLLKILAEDRMREPLNGVVVPVSYERLLGDADSLFDYGRLVRKRVDELMRAAKVHLPIYVVVTQCDQMSGFTAWCRNLPAEALHQPMGLLNTAQHTGDEAADPFIREAIGSVSDRIARLMLVLVNERQPDPELLRLPLTIDSVRSPLTAFADGLFQATTFEESPRFQGLYFTGREGEGEGARQAFARDFFTSVLPANRKVLSTLSGAERAERQTRRMVLSGWGAVVIAAFALLVGTWVVHKDYLTNTAEEYAGEFGEAESLPARVDRMHTLRTMTEDVDDEVSSWWMPWFGVPGVAEPEFVEELQQIFYERSNDEVFSDLDERFDSAIERTKERLDGGEVGDQELASLITALVDRINLLAAYSDGVRGSGLHEYAGPYDNSSIYFDEVVDPLVIERANGLYIQALIWSPDPAEAREELSHRRDQLVDLLEASGERMTWLIPWANNRVAGAGFELDDFWDGSGSIEDGPQVAPAFTIAGYEEIQDFLQQIWWSALDEERFEDIETAFMDYYQEQYIAEWEAFAEDFNRGTELLRGRDEWLQTVNSMATPRAPHFSVLETMYEHLDYFEREELPDWAKMVRFYDEMRSFAPDEDMQDNTARNRVLTRLGLKVLKKTGPLGKSLAKTGKKGTKTKRKLDRADSRSGTSPDERALMLDEAGQILDDYRNNLEEIAFDSDIRSVSFDATEALFSDPDNPGKGEGPKAQAHQKMRELQNLAGVVTQYNRPFWDIFTGPLDVIAEYYTQESACYVQEQWEDEFLVSLEGVSSSRLPEYMFGQGGQEGGGEVWSFVDSELDEFLERRPNAGYVPVRAGDDRLALNENLLDFLTEGRRGLQLREAEHSVRVEARPTSANDDAVRKPSRTLLQLRCEAGDEELANLNFPVTRQFNWDPTCGDTVLEIDIGSYTLEKRWEGEHGFAKFLTEFRTGQKRYRPEDFPRQQAALEDYGVEHIDVGFRFRGHQSVIARMNALPSDAPRRIASCWN